MSKDLSRADWDNDQPTDVDRWLEIYSQDDNLFWATDQGHILNVLDELLERLKTKTAKPCFHTIAEQLEEHSLRELIRMAKADAWDEGHATALRYAAYFGEHVPNPYRYGEPSE